MIVRYDSNNSGGSWWLDDEDWKALENAGWKVRWVAEDPYQSRLANEQGRWLGALATSATREGLSLNMAIAEWEDITGCNAEDQGCPCCGSPHRFYEDD